MKPAITIAIAAFAASASALAASHQSILFVGNSYTFGRVDPVMSYNTANVDDLTRPRPDLPDPNFTETEGTRPWEPHPWGGVPGIFKQLADQAGVEFDVSLSTRNAATLRGHFLNTANADWDLRGNIAKQKWDIVLFQEQSDAALPAGRGANANLPQFGAYADKIEQFIHVGAAQSYRERAMYRRSTAASPIASPPAARQPRATTTRCAPSRPIRMPAPIRKVYLTQTWARPDMVFPHLATIADANYPTVPDGRPIVDTTNPAFPNGFPDTLYYEAEGLAGDDGGPACRIRRQGGGESGVRRRRSRSATRSSARSTTASRSATGSTPKPASTRRTSRATRSTCGGTTICMPASTARISARWSSSGRLTGISPASFGASEKAAARPRTSTPATR